MKSSDRPILIGLAVLGALAAFWFLVVSPKRDEVASLGEKVTELEQSVQAQEQLAAAGESAKAKFDGNYRSLVVLGKAVPEEADTSSLFVQLDELSERARTRLTLIELSEGSAAPPAAATTESTVDGAEPTDGEDGEADAAPVTSAPATETAAASLPLGATVGPAGLPVMPYALKLTGTYFEVAEFLEGLDRLVGMRKDVPAVDGRLLTVDGFSLTRPNETTSEGPTSGASDELTVNLHVTTYVSPADQGLTAGASSAGPAAASTTPTTPTATATVTP